MKYTYLLFVWIVLFSSCGKDETSVEVLNERISAIIPKAYQDTLKKIGLQYEVWNDPPTLEGIFVSSPNRLWTTNITEVDLNHLPGVTTYYPAYFKFSNQKSDFSIDLTGKNIIDGENQGIQSIITGYENVFTVFTTIEYKVEDNVAVFGVIITGKKDGNAINNLVYGFVNIDNSRGGDIFIDQGEARMLADWDEVSEKVGSWSSSATAGQRSPLVSEQIKSLILK